MKNDMERGCINIGTKKATFRMYVYGIDIII
jgi:hypothetical protein